MTTTRTIINTALPTPGESLTEVSRESSARLMAWVGPSRTGKTSQLIQHLMTLLQTVPSDTILYLALNAPRKQRVTQHVLTHHPTPMGQLPVYTFAGLVRNMLFHFWPLAEERLAKLDVSDGAGFIQITPILGGMEDSELLLHLLYHRMKRHHPEVFTAFPGNAYGLVKQITRRLRLRAENHLSRRVMTERSRLLELPAGEEVLVLEQAFDKLCYRLRMLDTNKQLEVFAGLYREEPLVQEWLRQHAQHILVDDLDEATPAQQTFLQYFLPYAQTVWVAGDPQGGSRRGYLNAYPPGFLTILQQLEALQQQTSSGDAPSNVIQYTHRQDAMAQSAERLCKNWQSATTFQPLHPAVCFALPTVLTRVEMQDQVVRDILQYLALGGQPGELTLVVPSAGTLDIYPLYSKLSRYGIPIQLMSGTQRPSEDPLCWAFLNLLHLTNVRRWQVSPPSRLGFKAILSLYRYGWQGKPHAKSLRLRVSDALMQAYKTFEQADLPPLTETSTEDGTPEESTALENTPDDAHGTEAIRQGETQQTDTSIPLWPEVWLKAGLNHLIPDPLPELQPEEQCFFYRLGDWLLHAQEMSLETQLLNLPGWFIRPWDEAPAVFPAVLSPVELQQNPQDIRESLPDLAPWQRIQESFLTQKQLADSLHKLATVAEAVAESREEPQEIAADVMPEGLSGERFEWFWLQQVQRGEVADTPDTPAEIDPTALVMATPQKVIDLELRRPLQFWLDTHSRQWCRSDTAPLYHTWVQSAWWPPQGASSDGIPSDRGSSDPSTFSLEEIYHEAFEESLTRLRAAHVCRALMLLAQRQVRFYGSELDDEGLGHTGLMPPRLEIAHPTHLEAAGFLPVVSANAPNDPKSAQALRRYQPSLEAFVTGNPAASAKPVLTLRSDQAPVLQYTGGTMAITAVPGAGKTFVNVALVEHLVKQQWTPESILVLTFMDSAAKTLLGRLKGRLQGEVDAHGAQVALPVVSTIHSLAMRILTETDRAVHLGLLPSALPSGTEGANTTGGVQILDELEQTTLYQQIGARTMPQQDYQGTAEGWAQAVARAIGYAKNRGISIHDLQAVIHQGNAPLRLAQLLPAYAMYQSILSQRGLLDYTDLILKALILLEQDEETRTHYQRQFSLIIEDEAQDSSRLLQRLLGLLGGTQPNLIRTGDTNQSITTTFSAADTGVFRGFLNEAKRVVQMDYSGRCAPEVIAAANHWITVCQRVPGLETAFVPVAMRPIPGVNPSLDFPMTCRAYGTDDEEWTALCDTVERIRQQKPGSAIAVLVRNNQQVQKAVEVLQAAGIQAMSFLGELNRHPVFLTLLAFFRVLLHPEVPKHRVGLYQALRSAHAALVELHHRAVAKEIETFLQEVPCFQLGEAAIQAYPFQHHQSAECALQLYYDWQDFERDLATGDPVKLMIRMTEHLFERPTDRSNGYLCAVQAQQWLSRYRQDEHIDAIQRQHTASAPELRAGMPSAAGGLKASQTPLELLVWEMEQYQLTHSRRKTFPDDLLEHSGAWAARFVQVMTLHKSKGQEFDVVMMPCLTARALPHTEKLISMNEGDRLVLALRQAFPEQPQAGVIAPSQWPLLQQQFKQDQIQEEARLAYVGLTRAKRGLFLSTHQRSRHPKYNKWLTQDPALLFDVMSRWCAQGHGKPTGGHLEPGGELHAQ